MQQKPGRIHSCGAVYETGGCSAITAVPIIRIYEWRVKGVFAEMSTRGKCPESSAGRPVEVPSPLVVYASAFGLNGLEPGLELAQHLCRSLGLFCRQVFPFERVVVDVI